MSECAHVCANASVCVCVYLPSAKQMLYLTALKKKSKKYVELLSLTLLTASALLAHLSLSHIALSVFLDKLPAKSSQPREK